MRFLLFRTRAHRSWTYLPRTQLSLPGGVPWGGASLALLLVACGSSQGGDLGSGGTGSGGGETSGTAGSNSAGGGSAGGSSAAGGESTSPNGDITIDNLGGMGGDLNQSTGDGTPEVCDGKDNDGDGNIDNVDAGGDGICDCLNIGTVGRIGPWSNGGDIFKDWLDTRSPLPAFEIGNDELTEEILAPLDVVVVLRADTAPLSEDDSPAHHEFSEAEVAALESWVTAGGGMMTTIGYQGDEVAEVVNVNLLLEPFGLGYDPDKTDLDAGFLETWNQDHPISMGVERINIDNGVQPYSSSGTVVARGQDDRVGVVADTAGEGRVIVFGDEWVTYDSEWQDTEDQQVELLWLNMIKWMSPPEECQVAIPPDLVR